MNEDRTKADGFSRSDGWTIAFIVLLSVAAAALMWTRLHSLIELDPVLWLQQTVRMARGQVPYRDFLWLYPPLAMLCFGWPLRWFGQTFQAEQVLIDFFSFGVVLGCYFWTRWLLPRRLHAICIALVIALGVTSQTYFSLFSFLTYGPALHVAACGVLTLVPGVLRYIFRGPSDRLGRWLMVAGAAIGLTAKPETIVVTVSLFGILVLSDRIANHAKSAHQGSLLRRYGRLAVLWFVPATVFYGVVGAWTGFTNLLRGIAGAGLAGIACPWWPTGFGLLSAVAALGLAVVVFALASLAERRRWVSFLGPKRYRLLWVAATLGLAVYVLREAVFHFPLLSSAASPYQKMRALLPDLLSTSGVFRSAQWSMIVYWIWISAQTLRTRTVSRERLGLLVVLTVPVAMSVRSLFGTHMAGPPEVPAIAYPFLMVLTPWVLLRVLSLPHGESSHLRASAPAHPVAIVAALIVGYIAVRLVGGWSPVLSPSGYTAMQTAAGTVHVTEIDDARRVYDYVMAHTKPTDPILEVPYGGGIGFATGRPSLSFTTIWIQIPMPDDYQARDLAILRAHPPRVVIARDEPHLGSYYGVKGYAGCTFPCVAWLPDRLSWRPGYVYPAIQWVEQNYRVDARVGKWVLLLPK